MIVLPQVVCDCHLGSIPGRSTAGREAVNFAIKVRILAGELGRGLAGSARLKTNAGVAIRLLGRVVECTCLLNKRG